MSVHEQTTTVERQPILELTEFAIATLDDSNVESVRSDDGTETRELAQGHRKLTETVTPDGVRSFAFSQNIVFMSLNFDKGQETSLWDEAGETVDYTFRSEEHKIHRELSSNEQIEKIVDHLRGTFHVPAVLQETSRPRQSRLQAFLGRLSFR